MLLWFQGLIFSVLVPGVVAFYVPQALQDKGAVGARNEKLRLRVCGK